MCALKTYAKHQPSYIAIYRAVTVLEHGIHSMKFDKGILGHYIINHFLN